MGKGRSDHGGVEEEKVLGQVNERRSNKRYYVGLSRKILRLLLLKGVKGYVNLIADMR